MVGVCHQRWCDYLRAIQSKFEGCRGERIFPNTGFLGDDFVLSVFFTLDDWNGLIGIC